MFPDRQHPKTAVRNMSIRTLTYALRRIVQRRLRGTPSRRSQRDQVGSNHRCASSRAEFNLTKRVTLAKTFRKAIGVRAR
jgi:hypothetical protein